MQMFHILGESLQKRLSLSSDVCICILKTKQIYNNNTYFLSNLIEIFSLDKYQQFIQCRETTSKKKIKPEKIHKRDRFLQDYAVIVKHLWIGKPHLSLNLIEKFVFQKSSLKAQGKEEFKKLWNSKFKGKVEKVLSILVKVASAHPVVALAVSIAGLIFSLHKQEAKKNQNDLKKVLTEHEVQKIECDLDAYEECFGGGKNHFDQILSLSFMNKFSASKKIIKKLILGKEFKKFQINEQIQIVALYYRLSKIILQLTILVNKGEFHKKREQLREEHYDIKEILEQKLSKKIQIQQGFVVIKRLNQNQKSLQLKNYHKVINEQNFINAVLDELFRCPYTGAKIDELYHEKFWHLQEEGEKEVKNVLENFSKEVDSDEDSFLYIGMKGNYQRIIKEMAYHRIRKIAYDQKKEKWNGYYENYEKGSGVHDKDYSDQNAIIEFEKIRLLYLSQNCKTDKKFYIMALTKDYETKKILKFYDPQLQVDENMNFCLQFGDNQIVTEIYLWGSFNFKFKIETRPEKYYGPFTGFIAKKEDPSSRLKINFTKKKFIFDESTEGVIFSKVKCIQKFSDNQLSRFTCRISLKSEKDRFMVRKNRKKMSRHLKKTKVVES